MSRRVFTSEEDAILRAGHAAGLTYAAIAETLPGRTEGVVGHRACKLELPKRDKAAIARATALAMHPHCHFSAEEDAYMACRWKDGAKSSAIADEMEDKFDHPTSPRKVRVRLHAIRAQYGLSPRRPYFPQMFTPKGPPKPRARKPDTTPEPVKALRYAGCKVVKTAPGLWLVNDTDQLNLAQVRGRLEYMTARQSRAA